MKNWWYYHKWYVICGIILFLSIADIIANKFGWFKDEPDIQIAYIGEEALSEEQEAALKESFNTPPSYSQRITIMTAG